MMDGYRPSRDGEQVSMFILLPEAGQFLHPAHRDSQPDGRGPRLAARLFSSIAISSGLQGH